MELVDSSTDTATEIGGDESAVLSDESGFYGDEKIKSQYEGRSKEFDPTPFWTTHQRSLQWIAEQNREAAEAKAERARHYLNGATTETAIGIEPSLKIPNVVILDDDDDDLVATDPQREPQPRQDPPSTLHNPYENNRMAKQLSEPLSNFLTRLPPSITPSTLGPWIYIANPSPPPPLPTQTPDIPTLKQQGHRLLSSFITQRHRLTALHPDKPAASITRLLKPFKDVFEADLLQLARATGVVTGKWMLFLAPQRVDEVWAKVARATVEGELGVAAKVATRDDKGGEEERVRLVCVYTRDFGDRGDVRRVVGRLRALGLLGDGDGGGGGGGGGGGDGGGKEGQGSPGEGRGIFYKCDAYTYLDVVNGNEWKLKASMYGSRELLREG